jgi:hypothetical protein
MKKDMAAEAYSKQGETLPKWENNAEKDFGAIVCSAVG